MPFKSNAQRKYLFAKEPAVAREFAAHTPKGKKLPEHVKKAAAVMNLKLTLSMLKAAGGPGVLNQAMQWVGRMASPVLKETIAPVRGLAGRIGAGGGIGSSLANSVHAPLMGAERFVGQAGRAGQVGDAAAQSLGKGLLGGGALLGGAGLMMRGGGQPQMEAQASDQSIGTPFTDGFLSYCLQNKLATEQVVDLLEKGAQQDGRTGEECKAFLDRMLA